MSMPDFSRVLSKAESNGKRFLAGTQRGKNPRSVGVARHRVPANHAKSAKPRPISHGSAGASPYRYCNTSARPLFLDHLGRSALGGALALGFVQDLFAQPQVLGRRFQIFVGADVFEARSRDILSGGSSWMPLPSPC